MRINETIPSWILFVVGYSFVGLFAAMWWVVAKVREPTVDELCTIDRAFSGKVSS